MTRYTRGLLALTLISLTSVAGVTRAVDSPSDPIPTTELHVSPAPQPRFALRYLLEPTYLEQEPGNAAFLYQTATGQMMQVNSGDHAVDRDTLRRWLDDPIESLDLEKARTAIARFEPAFRLLDAAARLRSCTWEYPMRAGSVPYVSPLLNEYRTLFRLAAVKARLEIHDRDFDAALRTLRSIILFGRRLGDGPNFIQHLIGLAIAGGSIAQIETWIQQPGAPNLYWALTALPAPLVDIRNAVQMESQALLAELPELEDLEDAVLTNEQVLDLWKRAYVWLRGEDDRTAQWVDEATNLTKAMKRYPRAKARLLGEGYAAGKVNDWPALYVILLDQFHQFREIRDMTFKWTYVPYPQARGRLKEADRVASSLWQQGEMDNPFVFTLPAIDRIVFLDARQARDVAILRCVEAIRMYAAEQGGKLPGSLTEITAVPIPTDPLNGRPFQYERTGDKAILVSPVPPEGRPKDGRRYEITLR